ncbi:DUF2339 domain-containing protein [Priestia filamentosa]|uniref:DUF2339 domain-containing protein n=1 Tax=Priestia filamentosa TaxID=1402861 RepID=UPI00397D2F81
MSEDTRMDELEKRVKMLEGKVKLLERMKVPTQEENIKLSTIETIETTSSLVPQTEHESTLNKSRNIPLDSVAAATAKTSEDTTPPIKEETKVDYEKLIGQVWLPRIFIFVLIMGVLWGFKAAGDSGFITDPIKVVIGFVVAGILLFVGRKQILKQRHALGQVLLGGSVVILILSTFAAHMLYDLMGPNVSFVLNVIWVLLGIYLSYQNNSQPIAVISAVAGFLVPYLVESQNANLFVFVGYEVIFFVLLLQFSLLKKYIYLYYAAFGLLHFTFIAAYIFMRIENSAVFPTGIIIQYLFLVLAFTRKELSFNAQRTTLFSGFVLTQLWAKAGFQDAGYSVFLFSGFALYGILSFVYYKRDNIKVHVALPIATYALSMLILHLTSEQYLGAALLIEGLLALYVGFKSKSKVQLTLASVAYLTGAGWIAAHPISTFLSYETVAWLLLIGSLFIIRMGLSNLEKKLSPGVNGYSEVIGALGVLGVFISLSIAVFLKQVMPDTYFGFCLVLQGVITLFVELRKGKEFDLVIGTLVYSIGFIWTLFINRIPHLVSFETFAWLFLIISLVIIQKLLTNSEKENMGKVDSQTLSFVFWVLAATILYVATTIGHVVTEHLSTNVQSLTTTSIWAIYAIVSVVYGVMSKNRNIRILGIGLLFLTLLKLIFVDMTSVSILVRAILFIGVGFIGVAISRFFYSTKKED